MEALFARIQFWIMAGGLETMLQGLLPWIIFWCVNTFILEKQFNDEQYKKFSFIIVPSAILCGGYSLIFGGAAIYEFFLTIVFNQNLLS